MNDIIWFFFLKNYNLPSPLVQSLSNVLLFVTPQTTACQDSLSITNSQSLKRMSIASVMPSNHLILCRPLLPPSFFPSIRVFSNESVHIRWPKYWSFSFSISPSNEYSALISFRIDWFELLAVQETQQSSPTPQLKSCKVWPPLLKKCLQSWGTLNKKQRDRLQIYQGRWGQRYWLKVYAQGNQIFTVVKHLPTLCHTAT